MRHNIHLYHSVSRAILKRATNLRALLRKMTQKDKISSVSSPLCLKSNSRKSALQLFSAKEPLILGLFCGKWPTKIRYPMHICNPIQYQKSQFVLEKSQRDFSEFWALSISKARKWMNERDFSKRIGISGNEGDYFLALLIQKAQNSVV